MQTLIHDDGFFQKGSVPISHLVGLFIVEQFLKEEW